MVTVMCIFESIFEINSYDKNDIIIVREERQARIKETKVMSYILCIIILYSRHCRVRFFFFFFFSLVWVDDFFKTALHKLVSQQLIWDSNPFSSLICMTLLLSVLHLLIIKFNCRLLKFLFVRFGLPI